MLNAGLHILTPFVDKITFTRCMKAGLLDCPPQHVVTQDNVSLAGSMLYVFARYGGVTCSGGATLHVPFL